MSVLSRINNLSEVELIDSSSCQLGSTAPYVVSGEGAREIVVGSNTSAQLIVVNQGGETKLSITLSVGAKLAVIELYSENSESNISVKQESSSQLHLLALHLSSCSSNIAVDMVGEGALCRVNTIDMLSGEEQSRVDIVTNHAVARCDSSVHSKILVSQSAKAELKARAVVAKRAEQSTANQSLSTIELNDGARAKVWPELEIYNDDVKCSHGATMGQIDSDAILYMRQRGLSLEQARRVQMEGFIADVAKSVTIDAVSELVDEVIRLKFNEL